MGKTRLEAFSDGVLAIIITIMVLELKVPHDPTPAALLKLAPVFLSYVLSFIYVGIYWNNHHHLLHLAHQVSGGILWTNLHLLFWLSLVPFVTGWMGENHFAALPVALYGFVLLMAGVAFLFLQMAIVAAQGANSPLAKALGNDIKGHVSLSAYLIAVPCAFVSTWIAGALYIAVALMWLVPDKRFERAVRQHEK